MRTAELAELKKWQSDHRWSPNQLRHAAATEVRKQFGLEAAQIILGHSRGRCHSGLCRKGHGEGTGSRSVDRMIVHRDASAGADSLRWPRFYAIPRE